VPTVKHRLMRFSCLFLGALSLTVWAGDQPSVTYCKITEGIRWDGVGHAPHNLLFSSDQKELGTVLSLVGVPEGVFAISGRPQPDKPDREALIIGFKPAGKDKWQTAVVLSDRDGVFANGTLLPYCIALNKGRQIILVTYTTGNMGKTNETLDETAVLYSVPDLREISRFNIGKEDWFFEPNTDPDFTFRYQAAVGDPRNPDGPAYIEHSSTSFLSVEGKDMPDIVRLTRRLESRRLDDPQGTKDFVVKAETADMLSWDAPSGKYGAPQSMPLHEAKQLLTRSQGARVTISDHISTDGK